MPTTADSLLLFRLTFDFEIEGKEHRVLVNAKRIIGSDPSDRDVEVYAPTYPETWPIGVSLKADDLNQAVKACLAPMLEQADAAGDLEKA